jgi:hypothetical protein
MIKHFTEDGIPSSLEETVYRWHLLRLNLVPILIMYENPTPHCSREEYGRF